MGNVAVAVSWSGYFVELLKGLGITIPGLAVDRPRHGAEDARTSWTRRRTSSAFPIVCNLPAFAITAAR